MRIGQVVSKVITGFELYIKRVLNAKMSNGGIEGNHSENDSYQSSNSYHKTENSC